jgi:choline dehydrogenase
LLQQHGIAPLADLPGVGENLAGPFATAHGVQSRQERPHLEYQAASWFGKMKIGLEYAMFQSGPMSMAPSQLGAFARSDAGQATPNLQYHVQPLSLEKFGDPLHAFPAFTASVCNLRPTSRGHVRICGADSYARQKSRRMYLSTPEDRKVAADALTLTRQIVAAPALAVRAGGIQARNSLSHRGRIGRRRPARSAPRFSIRSAPARWAARTIRRPWSTAICASKAWRDCVSWMPR